MVKHGEGISWEAATHMSTHQRKWVLLRIKKDKNAQNEADAKAASRVKQTKHIRKH